MTTTTYHRKDASGPHHSPPVPGPRPATGRRTRPCQSGQERGHHRRHERRSPSSNVAHLSVCLTDHTAVITIHAAEVY